MTTKWAAVVDDNSNARATAIRNLKKAGYRTSEHHSAESFLADWKPGTADLIVSDWHLGPKERGDELFQSIRKRDWEVPLILVSGQLKDVDQRLEVIVRLLDASNTRFVQRGEKAFAKIVALAKEMEERRDKVFLRTIQLHRAGYNEPLKFSKDMRSTLLERLLADASFASRHEESLLESLYENIAQQEEKE